MFVRAHYWNTAPPGLGQIVLTSGSLSWDKSTRVFGVLGVISRERLALPMFALFIAAAAGLIAGGRPPISEMLGRLAPVTIAYLGDAVWELEARERALWPPNKLDTLSTQVQDICCAEGQYAVLERIVADFGLTEGELDWLRRGRNASARGPRRLEPKVYRASTSLETLVGVLHLTDRARLAELFDFVWADKARPGSNLADPQASPQVDTAHG